MNNEKGSTVPTIHSCGRCDNDALTIPPVSAQWEDKWTGANDALVCMDCQFMLGYFSAGGEVWGLVVNGEVQ